MIIKRGLFSKSIEITPDELNDMRNISQATFTELCVYIYLLIHK